MSLGGLADKILVYRSGFDPSYGTSFFLVLFFDHTHMHICVFGMQRVNKQVECYEGRRCSNMEMGSIVYNY